MREQVGVWMSVCEGVRDIPRTTVYVCMVVVAWRMCCCLFLLRHTHTHTHTQTCIQPPPSGCFFKCVTCVHILCFSSPGLVVPNIKHVEQRSVFEIAIELTRLIREGREGKTQVADIQVGGRSMIYCDDFECV